MNKGDGRRVVNGGRGVRLRRVLTLDQEWWVVEVEAYGRSPELALRDAAQLLVQAEGLGSVGPAAPNEERSAQGPPLLPRLWWPTEEHALDSGLPYVADAINGGYCETDEHLGARVRAWITRGREEEPQ